MKLLTHLLSFFVAISLQAQDTDGDGYNACPSTNPNILTCDCDDTDPAINPGPGNDSGGILCWKDVDADSWGEIAVPIVACLTCPSGYVDQSGDCDDNDPGRNPSLVDDPAAPNGIDEDCDCMPDNPTTPPTNDDWINATAISIGVDVSGDTYAADLSVGDVTGCGSNEKVVWYKFVATCTTHNIDFLFTQQHCNPPTSTAKAILHTESGGSLSSVNCPGDLNQCNNFTGQHQYTCLSIGTTYYMSVGFRRTNPYVRYTFRVNTDTPSNPLDDVCHFDQSALVDLSTSSVIDRFYNLDLATVQANEPSPEQIVTGVCDASQNRWCDNDLNGTIWIEIQPSTTGKISIQTLNTVANRLALYDGINCNTLFLNASLIAANDNLGGQASLTADCLNPATTYWLQVDLEDAASTTMVDLRFSELPNTCDMQLTIESVACGVTTIASQVSDGSGDWKHFTGDLTTIAGDGVSLIASVNDMGNTLGTVSVNVKNYVGASYRDYLGNPYLDRNFSISVGAQPAVGQPARVRFYFPAAFITAFINDHGLSSINDIRLIKCTSIVCVCGDFIGLGEGIPAVESGFYDTDSTPGLEMAFLEFIVTEFSSFYFFDQSFDSCPSQRVLSQNVLDPYYQANQNIATSGVTTIDQSTTFIAGVEICLTEDFLVNSGNQFEAQIGDCRN